MPNMYDDYLQQLRNIKIGPAPAISIYVPLKWADYSPGKVFASLVKAADGILLKEGFSRLELTTPEWDRWYKQGTLTLAIFHHSGVTNIIPLSVRMQPRVVVAKSFHVKPIITAASEYIDALLLHFHEGGATLYRINPVGESVIESYLPSEVLPKSDWPARMDRVDLREFLEFLKHEISGSTLSSTKLLGITGSPYGELRSETFWRRGRLTTIFLDDSFRVASPQNAFSILRLRLSQMVSERHSHAVSDVIKEMNQIQEQMSVIHLGEKIVSKEIKRLCVSLDDMCFGEVDSHNGEIVLHRTQKNTKDDDLLDDLIELAIENGVKVSVVPKKYLPSGRSFIAS